MEVSVLCFKNMDSITGRTFSLIVAKKLAKQKNPYLILMKIRVLLLSHINHFSAHILISCSHEVYCSTWIAQSSKMEQMIKITEINFLTALWDQDASLVEF